MERGVYMKNRFNIFIKVLTGFILVMAPLYILSLLIYDWGETSVKKTIEDSLQSQVNFYLTTLEEEIGKITKLQREFLSNEDLMRVAVAPDSLNDYELSRAIKRIWYQLNTLKGASIYVQKSSVYIPSIDNKISNLELTEVMSQEEFQGLYRKAAVARNPLFYWQNKLNLSETYPKNQYNNEQRTPMFVLGIELSKHELERYLQQMVSGHHGVALLQGEDWSITNATTELALGLSSQSSASNTDGSLSSQGQVVANKDGEKYITIMNRSQDLGITLSLFVPEEQALGQLILFRKYYRMITMVSLLIVTIYSYWIYRVLHKPLNQLVRAFNKVVQGNMTVALYYKGSDEFAYLYANFNKMVVQLKMLIQEVYEHKIRIQRSELKQLQSQINPHFLYNSFYILHRMAKMEDTEKVSLYTKYLGDYFQFVTRDSHDEITLEEEVNHSRAYVEIQNFRFGDRISVQIDPLPEHVISIMVPRLILQPLVENAYQYALEGKIRNGLLHIRFRTEQALLVIEVEDNGAGLGQEQLVQLNRRLYSDDDLNEVTALPNISRRLKLKYGPAAGLLIKRNPDEGITVEMTILL
jgi:two-component system sensor histidine kinase YesM